MLSLRVSEGGWQRCLDWAGGRVACGWLLSTRPPDYRLHERRRGVLTDTCRVREWRAVDRGCGQLTCREQADSGKATADLVLMASQTRLEQAATPPGLT